jgi:hypothetical protein
MLALPKVTRVDVIGILVMPYGCTRDAMHHFAVIRISPSYPLTKYSI